MVPLAALALLLVAHALLGPAPRPCSASASDALPLAPPDARPRVWRPPDSLSALLTARSGSGSGAATAFSGTGSQQPKADAFINEVTELLTGMSPQSAKSPGTGAGAGAGAGVGGLNVVITPPLFPAEESWPGSCRLRSKRYVSDGLCMSPRPLTEVVCADTCVMNAWTKGGARPLPWRCSDAGWRRKRVKLMCRDGSTRSYRIRVVQSCRCVPRPRQGQHQDQEHHDQEHERERRRRGRGQRWREAQGGD